MLFAYLKGQNEGEKASFSCMSCHILEANHNNACFLRRRTNDYVISKNQMMHSGIHGILCSSHITGFTFVDFKALMSIKYALCTSRLTQSSSTAVLWKMSNKSGAISRELLNLLYLTHRLHADRVANGNDSNLNKSWLQDAQWCMAWLGFLTF